MASLTSVVNGYHKMYIHRGSFYQGSCLFSPISKACRDLSCLSTLSTSLPYHPLSLALLLVKVGTSRFVFNPPSYRCIHRACLHCIPNRPCKPRERPSCMPRYPSMVFYVIRHSEEKSSRVILKTTYVEQHSQRQQSVLP